MRIVIFGGTAEAVDLANALVRKGHQVTTSLAGVTRKPRLPNGDIQQGGFGGVTGLIDYVCHNDVEFLVDATHPFAAQMSTHIVKAAQKLSLPLLRLIRPPWQPGAKACWQQATSIAAAADQLPDEARVLATVGRQHIDPLILRKNCTMFIRAIEHPEVILPPHIRVILERPPFRLADELAFMRAQNITHLISKNAGGEQTEAKLDAAHMLSIQVIMIERPQLPPAAEVSSVEAALDVIAAHSTSAA